MGYFLFRQWGLCRFQSSLPFPRPPLGFDFFVCNGNRRTSAECPGTSSPRMCYREASAGCWRSSFPVTDRLAAACHPVNAHPPPPAAVGENPAAKKFTPRALCCSIAELWTQSSQHIFPPVSLLDSRLDSGKVTKCSVQVGDNPKGRDRCWQSSQEHLGCFLKISFPKKVKAQPLLFWKMFLNNWWQILSSA